MVRKILLIIMSLGLISIFGLLNVGTVGCLKSSGRTSVDLTKTAVCEVGTVSYNFTVSKDILDTIAGYMGAENPFPDGFDMCFTNTAVGDGVFSLGMGEEIGSTAYAVGLMNLTVLPQEVAEDADLNVVEYDLELAWSETIASDLWNEIGEDVISLMDAPFDADDADVVMIVDAVQGVLNTYFSGWTCTSKATCADLQNTESSISFSCSTSDITGEDIIDSLDDEVVSLLDEMMNSKDSEEDSGDGPSYEEILAMTLPAMTFDWNLTPCEDECSISTTLEINDLSIDEIMNLIGGDDGNENSFIIKRVWYTPVGTVNDSTFPINLTDSEQNGTPASDPVSVCPLDGDVNIRITLDDLGGCDDAQQCIAVYKNGGITYLSNTNTAVFGDDGYFYTKAQYLINSLIDIEAQSGDSISLCQTYEGECESELYTIKVYYEADFCDGY